MDSGSGSGGRPFTQRTQTKLEEAGFSTDDIRERVAVFHGQLNKQPNGKTRDSFGLETESVSEYI